MALAFVGLACFAYGWHDPIGGRGGDTIVGYALGSIATAMILWLMWLGVRKRQYSLSGSRLSKWLSEHVYLGASLLVIIPLHSGFEFGWNVHTLAYALLGVVVLSGFLGVIFYTSVPRLITENRPGEKLDALLQQIADLDGECRMLATELPDAIARAVGRAVDDTRIGGGFVRQLSGRDPGCPTAAGLHAAREILKGLDGSQYETTLRLTEVLARKSGLLSRVRRDLRLRALLDVWLYFHVPVSFALLAAVAVHIFVVFYYR